MRDFLKILRHTAYAIAQKTNKRTYYVFSDHDRDFGVLYGFHHYIPFHSYNDGVMFV